MTTTISDLIPAPEPVVEPTQDWYFTFGHGQRGYSRGPRRAEGSAEGFPLWNRYVVIHGTYLSSRDEMFRIFGPVWSTQYESREHASVDEFELVELVITEDGKR